MIVKKILFPLLSLFLIYDAQRWFFALLSSDPQQLSVGSSLFYAFMLNIDLLGIVAIPGFVYPLYRSAGVVFYRTPEFLKEDIVSLYKLLRVEYFRRVISFLFWKRGANRRSFFDGTKSGLHGMILSSQRAEFGHWFGLVVVELISINLFLQNYFITCLFATLFNTVLNLYPIILQRYHRIRVEKLLNRA